MSVLNTSTLFLYVFLKKMLTYFLYVCIEPIKRKQILNLYVDNHKTNFKDKRTYLHTLRKIIVITFQTSRIIISLWIYLNFQQVNRKISKNYHLEKIMKWIHSNFKKKKSLNCFILKLYLIKMHSIILCIYRYIIILII